MRHFSLTAFLNGALRPDELWTEIEAEVTACLAACAKGGSGHVILTDGPNTLVLRQHVDKLLAALAQEKLPLEAAAYIADALIMSDDFEWDDEAVAETLFFLSDESRPLTHIDVEGARSRLAAAH
ncbi:hypothetical protein V6R86_11640 [Sphingomonas kaistensis]|uniref:Uncharacterized protein n=1 Tax=Sphingomonas kaistensis TaxID=298708 RepID=A0ABZ2G421_9SPHN